jgi:serine/threonine protein kinase
MTRQEGVEAIFMAALEKETPQERVAYIEGACSGNPELLQRVRELLSAHEGSQGPLDASPPGVHGTLDQPLTSEGPGSRIGSFKLLQKLGEGGMGTVWVAEQTEPVKRRVALKVIKPGMDTRQVLRRFEAERQALALMDHTHIAKLFWTITRRREVHEAWPKLSEAERAAVLAIVSKAGGTV